MVRAVLFDLDDTLFDHHHCARTALAGVRERHDCFQAVAIEDLERAHATVLEQLHSEVMAGRLDLDAARIERFARLLQLSGQEPDPARAAAIAAAYRQGYLQARREVVGATVLLAAVQRRARVVVISNNLVEEQREKLRHCGLDRYVDVLVVSEEVGVPKPDRRIFDVALARAECVPEEAVMIGDSWHNDVEGARAVGIRAIWFSRSGAAPPDPSVEAITSLTPVEEVLELVFGETISRGCASTPGR